MNLESIGKLLNTIAVSYPRIRNEIGNKDGTKIRMDVVQEWYRHIGFLEYEEALQRLDEYMLGPDGSKIPKPLDLKKQRTRRKSEEWHSPDRHIWHLEFPRWDTQKMHGRLFDQEDREYVHDPTYEDGYHYNQQGRICTADGRVVH